MPRVKCNTPKSLVKVCVEFIANNFDIWCRQSPIELYEIGPEIGSNPFDQLPCTVLEHIVKANRNIDNIVLQHLLTPQLTRVVLCGQELLELASNRCPQLKHLRINGCKLNFWPKFEKLQVLQFSSGGAEDSFLHTIGTYCTDLRELDLRRCHRVTDYGIQGLCVSVDNLGRNCETLGQCKSIQLLSLERTVRVTKKGLQMALNNMPILRNLHHDATVEALAEIANNSFNGRLLDPPEFALSVLRMPFNSPDYESGNLRLALSLCPSVTVLRIVEAEGFSNIDLIGLSLMALKSIRELSIYGDLKLQNHTTSKLTFNGGVVPLLKAIGIMLKRLKLENLKNVNIETVVEFCPNLLKFCLIDNLSYTTTCQKVQKSVIFQQSKEISMFQKLRILNIEILQFEEFILTGLSSSDHLMKLETLVLLLSSPLLSNITILSCDSLTDHVFFAAAKLHRFQNLEILFLQNCHYVTKRGIDILMQDGNVLERVELNDCMNVSSEKNMQDWVDQAKKKNWILAVDCDEKSMWN
ncbi:uncharacterized protein LOC124192225 isoform X1 [Daphnia pulex]|uniref:uncharacterized protein LOC124192225 isoform X1 n=1 Tax=Daphnia pulex TaxID=6669 RepID=UPI001EE065DE|nr:uncharacterized protein LOC124192225 isoform X1 [Daphnia pulex]